MKPFTTTLNDASIAVPQNITSPIDECSFDVYHDLIQSIVSALEARDPCTAEHSLRVGDMVEQTCLLMGLPPEQTVTIHMAAHVHDIGKIGIPDAILLKPGGFTPQEFELMQDHARIGAEILSNCESLAPIAYLVLCHHERWDGLGYPNGLQGDTIPLGSRIIAICDSIDAMLGKRLYQQSLTQSECRKEIFNCRHTRYDPDVATFVLKHWSKIVEPIDFKTNNRPSDVRLSLKCMVPTTDHQSKQVAS